MYFIREIAEKFFYIYIVFIYNLNVIYKDIKSAYFCILEYIFVVICIYNIYIKVIYIYIFLVYPVGAV